MQNHVDFSRARNLVTAAVTLTIGAGDLALKLGGFTLGGIGTATFGAILLYQLFRDGEAVADSPSRSARGVARAGVSARRDRRRSQLPPSPRCAGSSASRPRRAVSAVCRRHAGRPSRPSTTGDAKQRFIMSTSSHARRYDMPSAFAAAVIEPVRAIASRSSILPGPMAMSSPLLIRRRKWTRGASRFIGIGRRRSAFTVRDRAIVPPCKYVAPSSHGCDRRPKGRSMKRVAAVHGSPEGHWVGDGFPVRTLFSYHDARRRAQPVPAARLRRPGRVRADRERRAASASTRTAASRR